MTTVTGSEETGPSPQPFDPLIVMFPEIAEVPKFTVMLLVVLFPVDPCGRFQIYEVAPETAGML